MKIVRDWKNRRWEGIRRAYSTKDVERLRGSIDIKYTLAEMGSSSSRWPVSTL